MKVQQLRMDDQAYPTDFMNTITLNAKVLKQNLMLPLDGHAQLAEPGCLCTKQEL